MSFFRAKFAAKRFVSPKYWRQLSNVLAQPLTFYSTLAMKLVPRIHLAPMRLRLKDGKTLIIREFWALFLFDEIFVQNCYTTPELADAKDVRTIIDVGANIGEFSIRAKQLWPDAQIIAIEPHPNNFAALQEHIQVNGLKDVIAIQAGLSEQCGSFDLYLSPRNMAGHSMYKKTSHSIQVQTRTLADAISMLRPPCVCDLLKIDCEGCEYSILSSLTPELAARIGCIVFEPEHQLYDVEELARNLGALGFQVAAQGNLLVCSRPARVSAASCS